MSQSISLYKAFIQKNRRSQSCLHFCLLTLTITLLSCKATETPREETPRQLAPAVIPADRTLKLTSLNEDNGPYLGEINSNFCQTDKIRWYSTKVYSPLGEHRIRFQENTAGEAVAQVDGYDFSISQSHFLSSALFDVLCGSQAIPKTALDTQGRQQLMTSLSSIITDCPLEPHPQQGFHCEPNLKSSRILLSQLRAQHKKLIRKYRRHPYILLRKTAITLLLAEAINAADPTSKLQAVCRVLETSLKEELPFALASQRWHSATCLPNREQRLAAAQWGLAESYKEIVFLKEIMKKQGRRGTLSVRIPRNALPLQGKDMRIKLKLQPGSSEFHQSLSHSANCWHPLYGSDPLAITLAATFGDQSEINRQLCVLKPANQTSSEALVNRVEDYIFGSTASETEFAITNGHRKLLRLPKGRYIYTIQAHAHSLNEAQATGEVSSGLISWLDKNPRPKLNQW